MKTRVIYSDQKILITEDFIRLPEFQDQVIRVETIGNVSVSRKESRNFKQGSPLFFVLGVISLFVFPFVSPLFFVLMFGSWFYIEYTHSTVINSFGVDMTIRRSSRQDCLKIARTITALKERQAIQQQAREQALDISKS